MLWERIYSSPKYHKERNGSNSMITKQTEKYSALFDSASKALGIDDPKLYITTLNEYFSNIVKLAEKSLQYTILPLDEETFDIDANTREIKIPDSFKNGVGVQGDQVAEIIYFTIDRYFDATDLDTQNIYIEWRNANGDEGLSKEYVRDLTTLPNKIIFGWPLSSKITESAGSIEFAVRFYSLKDENADTKEIVYSFATKPAKIMINKTMDLDITQAESGIYVDDVKNMILERFQNSELTDGNLAVDAPAFIIDLVEGADYDISKPDGYDEFTEHYQLRVSAYSTDGGRISYSIVSAEPNAELPSVGVALEDSYVLTKDTVKDSRKIYYQEVEKDGVKGWEQFTGTDIPTINETVYERVGVYYVKDAGKYRIVAQNRLGAKYVDKGSQIVTFPAPEVPNVKVSDGEYYSIQFETVTDENGKEQNQALLSVSLMGETPKGDLSYAWTYEDKTVGTEQNYLAVDKEGFYYASVTNTRNTRSVSGRQAKYRVTKKPALPYIVSVLPSIGYVNEAISFQLDTNIKEKDTYMVEWYEAKNGLSPDPTVDTYLGTGNYDRDSGLASYTPESDGPHYAVIRSVYNTFYSDPIQSSVCAVYNR